jgi:RES domain-containing protein
VTVTVWRIAVAAPSFKADDLRGIGAMRSGGRWNSMGTPLVYCASSIALAMLETLAHIRQNPLPLNRFLVRVELSDAVWASRVVLAPLPARWDALPFEQASQLAGDKWVANQTSAVMAAPSVIVPDEINILLNPAHVDIKQIAATIVKPWRYDSRFF